MRIVFTLFVLMFVVTADAQSHLPVGNSWGFTPWQPLAPMFFDGNANQKWQLRPFASVSAGYLFLGSGVSYLSAPAGLMLYHPLNKNVTGFAGVTVAPTVFSMSRLYTDPHFNPAFPGNFTGLGVNAGIQGGLMYTNDSKTFSISGSIGIERGSQPVYVSPGAERRKQ